jgi:IS5 family transposase
MNVSLTPNLDGRSCRCRMACSYWRRPLDAAGRARSRAIAPLRAPVERTFAILKRWYGYRRVRYRSLVKNALQLQLLAVAMNLAALWC